MNIKILWNSYIGWVHNFHKEFKIFPIWLSSSSSPSSQDPGTDEGRSTRISLNPKVKIDWPSSVNLKNKMQVRHEKNPWQKEMLASMRARKWNAWRGSFMLCTAGSSHRHIQHTQHILPLCLNHHTSTEYQVDPHSCGQMNIKRQCCHSLNFKDKKLSEIPSNIAAIQTYFCCRGKAKRCKNFIQSAEA